MLNPDSATAIKAFFNNRRLMFERLVKVVDKKGHVVPFVLKPAQLDFLTTRSDSDIVLKGRQMGFSTLFEADYLLDAMILPNLRVITVTQNEDVIPLFSSYYRAMWEHLPEVIEIGGTQIAFRSPMEVDNVRAMKFANGSEIDVVSSGGIRSVRGSPYHRALLTEVGIWDAEFAADVKAAVVGAMPPQGSRIVMESTAHGQTGMFWEEWNAAINHDSIYRPHFYHWSLDPDYHYSPDSPEVPPLVAKKPLTTSEQNLMKQYSLTFEHILYHRVQVLKMGQLKCQQEFPNNPFEAFIATGGSIFTLEQRELARRFVCPPVLEREELRVWKEPEPMLRYVVCVDSSQGVTDASDFDAITVLCVQPPYVEHVATWMGRVSQHELAREAANIAEHYNKALIVPEVVESSGGAVLMALTDIIKYKNIYARDDGAYGWKTTKWTKGPMIDAFKELLDRDLFRTYDARVADQMTTYEEHRTGAGVTKVGAPRGAHDDLLMTVMMGSKVLPEISRSHTKVVHYGRTKW